MVVIATLNIQATNNTIKMKCLSEFILKHNIAILALQEVNSLELDLVPQGYSTFINYNPYDLGTGFIFKQGLDIRQGTRSIDGRIITLKIGNTEIVNFYGYPAGRDEELRNKLLYSGLPSHLPVNKNIILLGDFNSVTDPTDRLNPGKIHWDFAQIMKGLKLKDVFHFFNYKERFTFYNTQGSTRIDRVYYRGSSTDVLNFSYQSFIQSDHLAVCVDFELPENERKSFPIQPWKLKIDLLKNISFKENFQIFLNKSVERIPQYKSFLHWWDIDFKGGLKKLVLDFEKEKRFFESNNERFMLKVLEQVRIKIAQREETYDTYVKIKNQIARTTVNRLELSKAKGHNKYPIESEVANVSHMISEINKREKSTIEELKDENGHVCTEQDKKIKVVNKFYKKLFTLEQKETDYVELLSEIENKVKDEDKTELEKNITIDEIQEALFQLPKGKAPGIDGIPTDFYVEYWDLLKNTLYKLFTNIFISGALTRTQKTGLVSLIPKKGDLSLIENWRPVSVLCADYKILAKLLANRIKPTLNNIINPNQTGGLAGRTITDNLQHIRNVLIKTSEDRQHGAIVGLDFQKAFDRVDREIIYRTLERFGFPIRFQNWIKILYEHSVSVFKINGQNADEIYLERGIKQGCPLAALLYIVYIEPFVLKIKKLLEGIRIGSTNIKMSCFIDDIHTFIQNESELVKLDKLIKFFHKNTNSQINLSKSTIMGLGKWKFKTKWPILWIKNTNTTEILGVTFSSSLHSTIHENTKSIKARVVRCLNTAKCKHLTIQQKAIFVNTYVTGKITHFAKVFPIPIKTTRLIQGMINAYIWKSRLESLPSDQLHHSPLDGGLGLVHIHSKAQSLTLSAFLQQLEKQPDNQNRAAIEYFSSHNLREISFNYKGPKKETCHPFFAELIRKAKKIRSDKDWTDNKAKSIYKNLLKHVAQTPKIRFKKANRNYQNIFTNINNPIIEPEAREHLFFFIHNILTTKDRLIKCRQRVSKTCFFCTAEENVDHLITCKQIKPALCWFKRKLAEIDPIIHNINEKDLFFFDFRIINQSKNHSILWMLAEFMHAVWRARQGSKSSDPILPRIRQQLYLRAQGFKLKHEYKYCNNIPL